MNKLLALIAATAFATGAMAQTATTPATMPKPTPVAAAPVTTMANTGQQVAPKAQVNADTKVAAKADAPVVKAQAKPAKKATKKKSKKTAPKKTT